MQAWVAREALPFGLEADASFEAAVEKVAAADVQLLGLGEPLHLGQDILRLRNRLFQRLVEAHGYTAIALESSFPRGRLVDDYVAGRGPDSYAAVQEAGFSHGFGRLEMNRELVEWMRRYNAKAEHAIKLRFYGFDSPTEMTGADSPRQVLDVALDYLDAPAYRERIEPLLGDDAAWLSNAMGRSEAATALRIATEDLLTELRIRRPELPRDGYQEAKHSARLARQLLNYHAEAAGNASDPVNRLLGIRDAMMADNLQYILAQEQGRGKVLAFAHNMHLQYGKAVWQAGSQAYTWWPAGAHLAEMFGPGYAVIGTGIGVSEAFGIGQPEPGTLEALLVAMPGPVRLIPTRPARALANGLPTRSVNNPGYFPLSAASLTGFDWLVVLDSLA